MHVRSLSSTHHAAQLPLLDYEQTKVMHVVSESDSHGRHIAGLLQGILGLRPMVTAVVKPGAKLLSVTSDTLPPPHTYTITIAGTNDVAAVIIEALLRINITVCDSSSAIMASSTDKSPSITGPVAAAELHHGVSIPGVRSDFVMTPNLWPLQGLEHDAGHPSAAGPPSATEPRDDPPMPAELHLKPPAAGLIDVDDPLSSGELSSVSGPPVENSPRVCPGTDSYAHALQMNKGDELTVDPNLFLEVPLDASRIQCRGCNDTFLEKLESLLSFFQRKSKDFIIIGDFNINVLDHINPMTQRLREMLNSLGLEWTVNLPTRVTATSSTAIDNVITNISTAVVSVLDTVISDHFAKEFFG
ncbi:hypothetical protein J6590_067316 [Homalodisca vitripennis]|nr:hypothetical protein J6590_067316 [Homalodisca vitripennis]